MPPMTDTHSLPRNGNSRTVVLSSQLTIVWRVFLPVFGTVFLIGFVVLFWFGASTDDYASATVLWRSRAVSLLVLVAWLFFLYRYLWPLKRVEADDAHVFISDYWNTARYAWTDVVQLEDKKRLGRAYVRMHLKSPGRFGQVIRFIPGGHYKAWLKDRSDALLP